MRLEPGQDPSAALKRIYSVGQLDTGGGIVKVTRSGQIKGGPTGFPGKTDDQQSPQFREDRHGPAYSNSTARSWLHGNGNATAKPNFDHSPKRGSERR